jgi:hypothetical protein
MLAQTDHLLTSTFRFSHLPFLREELAQVRKIYLFNPDLSCKDLPFLGIEMKSRFYSKRKIMIDDFARCLKKKYPVHMLRSIDELEHFFQKSTRFMTEYEIDPYLGQAHLQSKAQFLLNQNYLTEHISNPPVHQFSAFSQYVGENFSSSPFVDSPWDEEEKAQAQIQNYFQGLAALTYFETRNSFHADQGSTRFSYALAHRLISPQAICFELHNFEKTHGSNKSTQWIIKELIIYLKNII